MFEGIGCAFMVLVPIGYLIAVLVHLIDQKQRKK